jgi:hypothetical protein
MKAMSVEASPMFSASLEAAETAKTKNIIENGIRFHRDDVVVCQGITAQNTP